LIQECAAGLVKTGHQPDVETGTSGCQRWAAPETAAPDAMSGRTGDALELPRPGTSAGAEHVGPMITTATPAAAPYAVADATTPPRSNGSAGQGG